MDAYKSHDQVTHVHCSYYFDSWLWEVQGENAPNGYGSVDSIVYYIKIHESVTAYNFI